MPVSASVVGACGAKPSSSGISRGRAGFSTRSDGSVICLSRKKRITKTRNNESTKRSFSFVLSFFRVFVIGIVCKSLDKVHGGGQQAHLAGGRDEDICPAFDAHGA